MRPLSVDFWSWCNPCFSFDFCHSNLGLCPRVPGSQLALGSCLAETTDPFIPCCPASSCHKEFSQSGWKAFHTGWAIICAVFCHRVSVLLSQADLIEFLRTAGKDVNLGKFWVSDLRCCDYGMDTFYFVVLFPFLSYSFLQNVFLPVIPIFTCNKVLVINKNSSCVKYCLKHFSDPFNSTGREKNANDKLLPYED